jgi:hypothetical protein
MRVQVKTLTGRTIICTVDDDATVCNLKFEIWESEGIPPHRQRLLYSGRQMSDVWAKLSSVGVRDGATVHLVLRLGGPKEACANVRLIQEIRTEATHADAPRIAPHCNRIPLLFHCSFVLPVLLRLILLCAALLCAADMRVGFALADALRPCMPSTDVIGLVFAYVQPLRAWEWLKFEGDSASVGVLTQRLRSTRMWADGSYVLTHKRPAAVIRDRSVHSALAVLFPPQSSSSSTSTAAEAARREAWTGPSSMCARVAAVAASNAERNCTVSEYGPDDDDPPASALQDPHACGQDTTELQGPDKAATPLPNESYDPEVGGYRPVLWATRMLPASGQAADLFWRPSAEADAKRLPARGPVASIGTADALTLRVVETALPTTAIMSTDIDCTLHRLSPHPSHLFAPAAAAALVCSLITLIRPPLFVSRSLARLACRQRNGTSPVYWTAKGPAARL